MIRKLVVSLACAGLFAACGGPSGGSGNPAGDGTGGDGFNTSNDGLTISPADLTLLQGEVVDIKVLKGTEDVTDRAKLEVKGEAVALEGNTLAAAAPGKASITARLDDLEGRATPLVNALTDLQLRAPEKVQWAIGKKVQLEAVGIRGTTERKVTYQVAYASSDEDVATVDENGLATILGGGSVSFTASLGERTTAPVAATVTCSYPEGTQGLGLNKIMPQLSWPGAKRSDGTTFELDLADVTCSAEYKDVKTMLFVISAGWCGACTAYAQQLAPEAAALEAKGMKIATVEVQDYDGRAANSSFAYTHLAKITGNRVPGFALGDSDVKPSAGYFGSAGYLEYYPTSFVVRTRDMKIIADQKVNDLHLPIHEIAADPEADWSRGTVFVNKCGPFDEEAGEPNNGADEALPILEGTFSGGICDDSAKDIYQVQVNGSWTATLDYDAKVGRLALWVWDPVRDQIATINGDVVGSDSRDGREVLEYGGKVMIGVMGVNGESAPYTLSITSP